VCALQSSRPAVHADRTPSTCLAVTGCQYSLVSSSSSPTTQAPLTTAAVPASPQPDDAVADFKMVCGSVVVLIVTIIVSSYSNGGDRTHRRRHTDLCNGVHIHPHSTPHIPVFRLDSELAIGTCAARSAPF